MLSGPRTSKTVKHLKIAGNSSTAYINRRSDNSLVNKRPMSSKPLLFSQKKIGIEDSLRGSLGKRRVSPEGQKLMNVTVNHPYTDSSLARPMTSQKRQRKAGYGSNHQHHNSITNISFASPSRPQSSTKKGRRLRPKTAVNFQRRKSGESPELSENNTVMESSIDIQLKINERQRKTKKSISGLTYYENQEIIDTI